MVIGNGLLAKKFSSYRDNAELVIFASGVSDSKSTDPKGFLREKKLLQQTIEKYPQSLLVYFGTCSVKDSSLKETAYVQHKLAMEELIVQSASRYLICRLSNIVGKGGNKKTVFNYFYEQVYNNASFTLWQNSYRNILDIDDAYAIVDHLIRKKVSNKIVNVAAPVSSSVKQIVKSIENFLDKKGNYISENKGSHFEIDTSFITKTIQDLELQFDEYYLQNILNKYYNHGLSNS